MRLLMCSFLILTNADVLASFFGPVVCSSFAPLSSTDDCPLSPLFRLHHLYIDFLTLLRAISLTFTLPRRPQIDSCFPLGQFRHMLHSPHYRRFLPRFCSSNRRSSLNSRGQNRRKGYCSSTNLTGRRSDVIRLDQLLLGRTFDQAGINREVKL